MAFSVESAAQVGGVFGTLFQRYRLCAGGKRHSYFSPLPCPLLSLQVRNHCRHYFLSSKALKAAYDVATWAATQLAVSYTVAPFVMLAVEPTISLYK